jgi:hypothetical protein
MPSNSSLRKQTALRTGSQGAAAWGALLEQAPAAILSAATVAALVILTAAYSIQTYFVQLYS